MPKSITIAEASKFFVAICKSEEHSWLTLGAVDSETEQQYTLAYYGKRLAYAKDYNCKGRMTTLFGRVDGVLTRDYKFKNAFNNDKKFSFEYKAFDISRDNFLAFAQNMKTLVKDKYKNHDDLTREYHKNELYYPNKDNPNQFDFISINDVPTSDDDRCIPLDSDIEHLGRTDNCRHTSLSILKKWIQYGKQLITGISTFAYIGLPFIAVYYRDEIISNFYILPVPPSKESLNTKRYELFSMMYKCLEKMPKLKPNDPITKEKFCKMKALYNSLATTEPSEQLSSSMVLNRIDDWESKSAGVIDRCRLFNTRRTTTRKIIEQIKVIAHDDHFDDENPIGMLNK